MRLVIFDLDGTLLDSFPWFVRVLNGVATRYGFRQTGPEERERLRGLGPRDLMAALDVRRWKLPFIARHMRRLKTRDMAAIPLFPGVDELLAQLSGAGVKLAIVSSDHEANVRRALGPERTSTISLFDCSASLMGKRAHIARVVRRSGIEPHRTIYIGDEVRDAEAARGAGVAFGAVSWGYASPAALEAIGPAVIFRDLSEIAAWCLADDCPDGGNRRRDADDAGRRMQYPMAHEHRRPPHSHDLARG